MLARLAWRRRWLGRALALVLVFALPGAPLARSASVACSVCPPDCPMHGKVKRHLKCHRAKGSTARQHEGCARTPGISMPGCGYHGDALLVSPPPAIPSGALVSWRTSREPAPPIVLVTPCTRGLDPPATPPPIVPF
jgi:hypothetical protein